MTLVHPVRARRWLGACVLVVAASLSACSSGPTRPEPAPLPPSPNLIGVRQVWTAEVGRIGFPLILQGAGHAVALANAEGRVSMLDARTGEVLWSAAAGAALTAGVGHDGRSAAVVTVENQLVVLRDGKELWRQQLPAPSYTPPLVAGERVFVLGADRSVSAFDGRGGRKLWSQSRSGDPLVLREPGVLMAVGNTLVVGLSGRMAGLDPLTGVARWEVPLATPRGTNDVERLVDLVGGVARQGTVVCARAFQAAVGCVDAATGKLEWTKAASGGSGVSGNAELVAGVEFNGTLMAWRRSDGEPLWRATQLRYRKLTGPLVLGSNLVLGDDEGRLHFFATSDGALQARLETDGTAITSVPVLAGSTLVVVTEAGRVLGLRPE